MRRKTWPGFLLALSQRAVYEWNAEWNRDRTTPSDESREGRPDTQANIDTAVRKLLKEDRRTIYNDIEESLAIWGECNQNNPARSPCR